MKASEWIFWNVKCNYDKYFGKKDAAQEPNYLNHVQVRDFIEERLKAQEPFMFGKLGATESFVMRAEEFGFRAKRGKACAQLCTWSGFFPENQELMETFNQTMKQALGNVDILLRWYQPYEEYFVKKYANELKGVCGWLNAWASDAPWSKALKGKKVPVLVLDQRWHTLFPSGNKPSDVLALEDNLNYLLKRQGFLVNDIKDLKRTKQKLMDGILAGMGETEGANTDKKKKNQQRLLLEIKERIKEESDELMDLPREIKRVNEELLAVGAAYCFERLAGGDEELRVLTEEIEAMRKQLKEKVGYKADLEDSMDSAYSLMHGLLGHDVMNLYDKKKR